MGRKYQCRVCHREVDWDNGDGYARDEHGILCGRNCERSEEHVKHAAAIATLNAALSAAAQRATDAEALLTTAQSEVVRLREALLDARVTIVQLYRCSEGVEASLAEYTAEIDAALSPAKETP